ncbi:hypothetical protein E4U72_10860 [Escherichia coli O157:H7]|nr:hypothetical protein A4C50_10130 [Escherichia coli O157:H7]API15642.1 hypothetical protein BFL21_14375 [Escherichia coli]EZD79598.1 hypothetical protein BX05_01650 [Escherichia coli O157:NM str. 08-4540]AOV26503.1 hypothetical protein A4C44_10115 [Escherichia coli O157:H7]AOV31853.1 hypothetical protein A4C45_10125 [Escherichia coli O157:H7]
MHHFSALIVADASLSHCDGSLLVCIMDRELRIKDIPKPQNLIFRICRKGGVNKYPLMKTELVQM